MRFMSAFKESGGWSAATAPAGVCGSSGCEGEAAGRATAETGSVCAIAAEAAGLATFATATRSGGVPAWSGKRVAGITGVGGGTLAVAMDGCARAESSACTRSMPAAVSASVVCWFGSSRPKYGPGTGSQARGA